ncbi:Ig-like domain-containing protein [Phycicoccus sonneratiae]|uniref:Fibronectin type III domain-containing protein n=1 Tax=Phycicoccus sonneratiae TaxID=2807628 RepID=A0ABS2CK79_9MICO|nr:Ig-like domain-containing protein [Phycicoccus sonneraticus]MBM6399868.1 fibronectin type III domain-containing protein [Phycicoccus sonneraticus]
MSEERGTTRRGHAARRGPRRPRTGVVVATVLAVVLGGYGYAATRSPGYTSDHLEANDGTLWVTNDRGGLFGRLNAPAAHLDAAFVPGEERGPSYQLDVVQSGSSVLTRDRVTGKVAPVDVRAGTLVTDRTVAVPPSAPLAVGNGTAVFVDPDSGEVKASVSTTPTAVGVDGFSTAPVAQVPIAPDVTGDALTADVAVDDEGTAYAAGSGGRLVILRPTGDGRFGTDSRSLGGPLQDAHLVLTTDGPVVLDTVTGVIARPDGTRTSVTGTSLTDGVPEEGRVDGEVLVATPRALVSVDLATGVARTVTDGGTGPAAAPVVLDGCTYAAWSGSPGRAVKGCGGTVQDVRLDRASTLISPHLRLNHRSVALNDGSTGAVWSLDTGRRLDNWDAVAPPSSQSPPKDPDQSSTVDRSSKPPQARDDTLGARPGRTSILHVLDNDANPSGSVLSITKVSPLPSATGAVAISPDGQAVQLTLEPTARSAEFDYVIDDGRGNSSSARVTVEVRSPDENGAPALRPDFVPSVTSVVNKGSVSVPVVGDWRDPDSDPVAVTSAKDEDTPVGLTPDGRIRYTAGGDAGPRTVEYTVSDGTASTVGRLSVDVLAADAQRTTPATPLPDVGRGEVGKPIVLRPLDNDVPGTDPVNPSASLQLAGAVTAPDGTTVDTSLEAGTVSVTAGAPGTYLLTYPVRYGDANIARGAIRVDVRAASDRPGAITAMPDQAVLRSQTATIVDVLANDVDPAGGLLVVQGAKTESDAVDVAVLRGRWLRIAATSPSLRPNPALVRYTVTNGEGRNATGDVSVLQLPEPADDTPLVVDDTATVRSGDHVSVPVLDNDVDPTGATLRLSPRVEGAPRPGTLPVGGPDGGPTTDDVGAAYVAGSVVRYQAPEVTTARTVAVTYVVESPSGARASGLARINVVPPPSPERLNRAPAPPTLEGRVVAGDTITVSVAASGSDPDGDSTTLAGLASAPSLGRVLAVTPSSITYQAYPTSGGTDDFTYLLGDRYGKVGTGTVRIAVAPPGDPQPVVAVDDDVTVAPGATVVVDALANDIQPIGERATVEPLEPLNPDLAGRATLDATSGRITVTAPPADQPLAIRYSITGASGEPSTATVHVRGRAGTNLPPVPRNALAQPGPGATSVDVDLLAGAVDPDSPGGALTVTRVFNAPGARIEGGVVTLPVTDAPQVLSFEVTDAGGAAALGLVHVPAGGSGAPSVREDALVRVDRNATATVDLDDVVVDPAGRELTLTTDDRLAASPAGKLRVEADGPSRLRVTGLAGYVGPAAIAFEVSTAATADDPTARRAFLTVPVQVGPETPVLRCPPTAIDVVVGGTSRPLGIPQLCHVWTATPDGLTDLRFTGRFESPVAGLTVSNRGDDTLVVEAGAAAVPGSTARMLVTAEGTEAVPAVITVRVAPAEPPTMSPVVVSGVRAGSTATVNIEGYLSSRLGDPAFSIVGFERTSGSAASVTQDGPTTLSVTPAGDARGRITVRVTITDVESTTRRDRQGTGTLSIDVLGVPDAPGTPAQTGPTLSRSARLTWQAPNDNGLPVEAYEVRWEGGGTQLCDASPCLVTGLTNATEHRFTVRARNAVGWGPPSAASAPIVPDEVPGAPVDPRVVDPANRTVTVTWSPAPTQGSAVDRYLVTWPGGRLETTSTSVTPTGLDNTLPTPFTIRARNTAGWGPGVTVEGQSAGTPATPDAPRLEATEVAGGARQAVVVSWNAVSPNGPGDTSYTVTRTGPGGSTDVCRTSATRCDADAVENDGSTYEYRVVASNPFYSSPASAPASLEAIGTPGDFSNASAVATGEDRTIRLRFTSPAARDDSLTITCRVSGATCGSWPAPAEPTRFDEVVTVPANGSEYTLTLTATNSGELSSSTQVTSDVVYGPLGPVSVEDVQTVGPYVFFTVTADPNGRPATVAVAVTGGNAAPVGDDTTGNGPWSRRYAVKAGFSSALAITATASRGSESQSAAGAGSTGSGSVRAAGEALPGGGVALTLTANNLSPSTTLQCVVDEAGSGGTTTVGLPTDTGGDGTRAIPASEFTATSGTRYTITCDDGVSPETPVRRTWVAP